MGVGAVRIMQGTRRGIAQGCGGLHGQTRVCKRARHDRHEGGAAKVRRGAFHGALKRVSGRA
eukprot:1145476-Lingulodinium_polyedra.AAC.1